MYYQIHADIKSTKRKRERERVREDTRESLPFRTKETTRGKRKGADDDELPLLSSRESNKKENPAIFGMQNRQKYK